MRALSISSRAAAIVLALSASLALRAQPNPEGAVAHRDLVYASAAGETACLQKSHPIPTTVVDSGVERTGLLVTPAEQVADQDPVSMVDVGQFTCIPGLAQLGILWCKCGQRTRCEVAKSIDRRFCCPP